MIIKEEVIKKYEQMISENRIIPCSGAFGDGDLRYCTGIYDGKVEPPEGGTLTKFLGCSYLYKSHPLIDVTEGLGLAKSMISAIPREIIGNNLFYQLGITFTYLFNRKKFYHEARIFCWGLYFHIVSKYGNIPEIRYNDVARELRRTTIQVALKEIQKSGIKGEIKIPNWYSNNIEKIDYIDAFVSLMEFFAFFIENDNAYRFRLQDGFENLNKENVNKNPLKELKRIFDIMIERENDIKNKIIFLKKVISVLYHINSDFRRILKEFLLELNIDKIKLDELDWYYCLDRKCYNHRGISHEQRLEEKKKIDKEKGHILFEFIQDKGEVKPI